MIASWRLISNGHKVDLKLTGSKHKPPNNEEGLDLD